MLVLPRLEVCSWCDWSLPSWFWHSDLGFTIFEHLDCLALFFGVYAELRGVVLQSRCGLSLLPPRRLLTLGVPLGKGLLFGLRVVGFHCVFALSKLCSDIFPSGML